MEFGGRYDWMSILTPWDVPCRMGASSIVPFLARWAILGHPSAGDLRHRCSIGLAVGREHMKMSIPRGYMEDQCGKSIGRMRLSSLMIDEKSRPSVPGRGLLPYKLVACEDIAKGGWMCSRAWC